MGGRGSGSGKGTYNGIKIPKMRNPAGIPSNAITEDEYLHLRGYGFAGSGYSVDKLRGNRQLRTQRGEDRFFREVDAAQRKYDAERAQAKQDYKTLIDAGKIRDKTSMERRLTAAHGHPDNSATQAARRMLEKQGIDWRTGKKKAPKKSASQIQ